MQFRVLNPELGSHHYYHTRVCIYVCVCIYMEMCMYKHAWGYRAVPSITFAHSLWVCGFGGLTTRILQKLRPQTPGRIQKVDPLKGFPIKYPLVARAPN